MWPLSVGSDLDNMLILSFVEQTRVLSLIGEEVIIRILHERGILFRNYSLIGQLEKGQNIQDTNYS